MTPLRAVLAVGRQHGGRWRLEPGIKTYASQPPSYSAVRFGATTICYFVNERFTEYMKSRSIYLRHRGSSYRCAAIKLTEDSCCCCLNFPIQYMGTIQTGAEARTALPCAPGPQLGRLTLAVATLNESWSIGQIGQRWVRVLHRADEVRLPVPQPQRRQRTRTLRHANELLAKRSAPCRPGRPWPKRQRTVVSSRFWSRFHDMLPAWDSGCTGTNPRNPSSSKTATCGRSSKAVRWKSGGGTGPSSS
jgi:hypothetical protein